MQIRNVGGSAERLLQPTCLEWLRELKKRGGLDEDMYDEWTRLEAGDVGEQYVLGALEKFGEPHWVVVPNVWLEFNGHFECDLVVLTHAGLYAFEVKNYSGHYVFRDMQCFLNDEKIGHHAINQAQRSYVQLEKLMKTHQSQTNVFGVLAFVGEHHSVEVRDPVNGLHVVMRNRLRNFIWGMAKQERLHQGPPIDVEACIRVFERYGAENRFVAGPLTNEIKKRTRSGICCSECGSFDVVQTKHEVSCSCGVHESREHAIVRTICEYGVIHFEQELVIRRVLDFFGKQVSRSTLRSYLNQYFVKAGSGRYTYYQNPRLPFTKIANQFNLPPSRYLVLD